MNNRIIGCAVGMLVMSIMMSACAENNVSNDQDAVVFEKVDEVLQEADNHENSADLDIQNDSSLVASTIEDTVSSLTEYLQRGRTEFLENGESYIGTPAVNRYEEFLSDKNNWPGSGYDSIHIALGLIDDDDIPELFVVLDTISVYGVHIYKYDPDSDSVIYLGEFSQFGYCCYSDRKNRIWGQYGNHGYYELYYYEIVGNNVKVVGRLLYDAVFKDIKYYADYADEFEASAQQTHTESTERPDDSYLISEEEFERREEEFMKTIDTIKIGYDNMTEIVLVEE
jgi:hypothetical protein